MTIIALHMLYNMYNSMHETNRMKNILKTKVGIVSELCEEFGITRQNIKELAEIDIRVIQSIDKGEFVKISKLQDFVDVFDGKKGLTDIVDPSEKDSYIDFDGYCVVDSSTNDMQSQISLFTLNVNNCDSIISDFFSREFYNEMPKLRFKSFQDEALKKDFDIEYAEKVYVEADLLRLEDKLNALLDDHTPFSKIFPKHGHDVSFDKENISMDKTIKNIKESGELNAIIKNLRDQYNIFISVGTYIFYEEKEEPFDYSHFGLLDYDKIDFFLPTNLIKFNPINVILFVIAKQPYQVGQVYTGTGIDYYRNAMQYPGVPHQDKFNKANFRLLSTKNKFNHTSLPSTQDFIDMLDISMWSAANEEVRKSNVEYLNELSLKLNNVDLGPESYLELHKNAIKKHEEDMNMMYSQTTIKKKVLDHPSPIIIKKGDKE